MKKRLQSFVALVVVIALATMLDIRYGVFWFTALLLSAILTAGTLECHSLLLLAKGKRSGRESAASTGSVLLALGCIALPGASLLALRLRDHGMLLVLYVVAIAKMTDNGALLIGTLWGRRKLAPKISPGKTVEGLWGGLAIGILTAVALAPVCTGADSLSSILFGIVISVLAVLGDLAESFLKRKAGTKDSGALLPGIGGILDLMDSVLLSAPAGYFLLVAIGKHV